MKRRDFVRHSAIYAAAATQATRAQLSLRGWSDHLTTGQSSRTGARPLDAASITTLRDPRVRALALDAVEAARRAGAAYADVRLTNTMGTIAYAGPGKGAGYTIVYGLSVRALVNGYWGWAATPMVSTDEAVRVARLATQLATQSAAHGKPRAVELGTIPIVQDGDWTTPAKVDPFTVDPLEARDWLSGLEGEVRDLAATRGGGTAIAWTPHAGADPDIWTFSVEFDKQERLLATSEGTLCTQTILMVSPIFNLEYRGKISGIFDTPTVQAGWDYLTETPIVELFIKAMDEIDAAPPPPPVRPVEVGLYDMVFSAKAMSKVLRQTFGDATQLDRALGYEANADGTSYLGPDPLRFLDTAVASPLVTVTADRSMPLGLANVQWDDEGVRPEEFSIVQNGMFTNYQTTREQAAWLAPYYVKHNRAVRSLGCAMAPTAQEVTMQHTPNLTLQPGVGDADEQALVRDLERGLLIHDFALDVDWQCRNLYTYGLLATEIRNGKPVATITGGALQFRADTFWKDMQALGGAASARLFSGESGKGEPRQVTFSSTHAVPARIKQLALIDPMRKAS